MPGKIDWFYSLSRFQVELCDRKYQAALDQLSAVDVEVIDRIGWFTPMAVLSGHVYRFMNEQESAKRSYEAARMIVEKKRKEQPKDPAVRSMLAIIYAGLGRKPEALREATWATKLQSAYKDTARICHLNETQAYAYVMLGEFDTALDRIESLLSTTCDFSVPLLKIEPLWDPLRNHPRFQQLVAKG